MYRISNCRPKFSRLEENFEENLEHIAEEISFLKSPKLNAPDSSIYPHKILQEPTILFNIARKLWRQAEDVFNSDASNVPINEIHTYIIDLLKSTRYVFTRCKSEAVLVTPYLEVFKKSIAHPTELSASELQKVTNVKQPAESLISQYFHLYLDLLWLILTVDDANGTADVKHVVVQLAFLTFKMYDASQRKINVCKCLRSLWLCVQIYCETRYISFWETFTGILECYDECFSIQILAFTARLHCYNENGVYIGQQSIRIVENWDFLRNKWEIALRSNPSESDLLQQLRIIDELSDLWLYSAKLDFLYLKWDYFYKKIEVVEVKGEIIPLVNSIRGVAILDDSYMLFLRILYKHLKRHPQHWNKFRGRVYTRFSTAKFAKLNYKGAFNLFVLFFTIIEVSFDEISKKLLEFLNGIPKDKENSSTVWKLYITLIQLNLSNNKPIENISLKFIQLLNEVSLHRNQFHLLTPFTSTIGNLLTTSEDMNLKQNTLFGAWIENYMKSCQSADLTNFLNALIFCVERITEAAAWYDYEKSFGTYVLPSLKRLALTPTPIESAGTLAGLIAANSTNELSPTMTHFSSELVPATVMSAFFCTLSKRTVLLQDFEGVVLKAWFQCAIIGEANAEFTKFALSLDLVKLLGLHEHGLPQFIEALGRSNDQNVIKACFEALDKWLTRYLGSSETVVRSIYVHMALIFTECSRSLYNRSSASCCLSKLIDVLLLPTDILRGIKPNENVLKALEKTWYIYVFSIHNLTSCDPYLERVLKDLIIRYIPFFQIKPTPLLKILSNKELTIFALTKISNEYFMQGISRNDHIPKALATLQNLVENVHDLSTIRLLAEHTLPGIFEIYMFKNQKVPAVDFLKLLTKSEWYVRGQLNDVFKKCLIDVTKKHLPFNTGNYFQMIYVFTKIIQSDVKGVLNDIKDEVKVVEIKRGQGFDNSLRLSFDKLQKLID